MIRKIPPSPGFARQRGLSIIELMVGVTIGLFILAGATLVATTQLGDNRKMLLEAQVQQDLRTAADLVARDLRRAAYWAQSWRNVWPQTVAAAMTNPYAAITPDAAANGSTSVVFSRSLDEDGQDLGTDNNAVDNDEQVGFRYNDTDKTVEMLVSANNWQQLTDPSVLEVTQFAIVLNSRSVPLPCGEQCPTLGPGGCPLAMRVRDAEVTIAARAVSNPAVTRSVHSVVRLRNDVLGEQCP